MQNLSWKLAAEVIGGALFVLLLVWFFFLRPVGELAPSDTVPQQTFTQNDARTDVGRPNPDGSNAAEPLLSPTSPQKIFKIHDGPVAGAVFMQEGRPTTTIARFVMQQNGHMFDLPIDSPGAVSRSASNTTIPGAAKVAWSLRRDNGREVAAVALMQYLSERTVKTLSLSFPATTSTPGSPAPVRIQFLPDNVTSLAASPDGTRVVYLLKTPAGSDGYVAQADGSSPVKVFSLPLWHIVLNWPSTNTILATSKAAAGVPGMAFFIDPVSGSVAPTLYAAGLTATAGPGVTHILYQRAGASRETYAHEVRTNLDRRLSFDPLPEKCAWSRLRQGAVYCAVPLSSFVPANYVDLWHQGSASASDSIVLYDLSTGQTSILATPGNRDGGVPSDILEMALSADEKYLLFITKGARSLWGVRLN